MSIFLTTEIPTDYYTRIWLNLELFFFLLRESKVMDYGTVLKKNKSSMKTKDLHSKYVKKFCYTRVYY